jgi:hypothetical protein
MEFNFNHIAVAAHTAIANGDDIAQATKKALPTIKKAQTNVAELVRLWTEGEAVSDAVQASFAALASKLRDVLIAQEVDTTSTKDVRDALRAQVWLAAGYAEPVSKKDDKTLYERIAQRLSRMAAAIVGKTNKNSAKEKVRVPKELQDAINAAVALGYERKVVTTAVARAFSKV